VCTNSSEQSCLRPVVLYSLRVCVQTVVNGHSCV